MNKETLEELGVTEDMLEDYRESFKMFDADGDNCVSKDELRIAMRSLGHNPTEAELDEIMSTVDTNKSGTIEFEEFVIMMTNRLREVNEEEDLKTSFAMFDKDGNGYISVPELKYIMTNIGEKMSNDEVECMLREADVNGDGQLCYEEFVKMMTMKPDQL